MKKTFLAILLLAAATPWGGAVETASGKLSTVIGEDAVSVTELSLTGTMDARDFKYISDSMPQLSVLDISGVTIEEYSDREPLFANFTYYPADELPKYSLMGKPLTSVSLPSTLTSIGEAAFAGCAELTEISLPSTVATIGNYAFSSASKLADVKGGEGVRTIGDYAFSRDAALTTVASLPQVEIIGGHAFSGCSQMADFTFAPSLRTIGESAFAGSGLTSADMSGCTSLSVVGAWAFADNGSLREVNMPATVTSLGEGAFFYSSALQQVALPEGLVKINEYTFMGGKAVATVTLPEGLKEIGDYAFSDWTTVREIIIPSTVEYIGDRAMRNWNSLAELTSNAVTPPSLGDNVWENVDYEKVNLTVPAAGEMAYRLAEQWQDFFKSSSAKPLAAESLRVAVDGDVVTITSGEEISTVQLFDMSGILLQSAAPHSQQFSLTLSGYSGRAYVVRCVSGGNEKIIKISRQ